MQDVIEGYVIKQHKNVAGVSVYTVLKNDTVVLITTQQFELKKFMKAK
jgi:hypothetical protein